MDFSKLVGGVDGLELWLKTTGATIAFNVVAALVLFILGRIAARMLARVLCRTLERTGTDPTLVRFLNNLIYAVLLLFVVVIALDRVGVNTTSFAAVLGAAGLAVGLALQGSLSNFAAGVMIISLHHFRVGDQVEVSGQSGKVVDIQIFHSVLMTAEGVKVILPNGGIVAGVIKVHPPAKAEPLAKTA